MKGRLYLVIDRLRNKLDVVTEIEGIGDGRFIYEIRGVSKLVKAEDIMEFSSREDYFGDDYCKYCNNLDDLIIDVWKARYNPLYQKVNAIFKEEGISFEDDDGRDWSEKYHLTSYLNLLGDKMGAAVSNKGRIIIDKRFRAEIEWDSALSASSNATVTVDYDAFIYRISYKDCKEKPSKGYSRMSNYISNYISAFPEGVSSRDIEFGLKIGHPTVAGRISEMDDAGRISRVGIIRYYSKGKANSIWVISKE